MSFLYRYHSLRHLTTSIRSTSTQLRSIPSSRATFSNMSALHDTNNAAEVISETMKAEGGPSKGSTAAQMQSEVAKSQQANTTTSNKSEAGQMISEVAKAEGGTTKGSTSAKMQSELTKAQNAGQTPNLNGTGVDPTTRSHLDKEANFSDAASKITPKMQIDPEHVTKEDANLLRSREQRAHGTTEKGGVAATAQHLAAENEQKGTI